METVLSARFLRKLTIHRLLPGFVAFVACIGVLALSAQRANATAVMHFTLDDLVSKAVIIAHVKVASSSAAWDAENKRIFTTYKLEVTETLKGKFEGDPTCQARGGTVGRKGQAVSGEAYLDTSAEYVLFIEKDDEGRNRILGLGQGMFKVTREEGQPVKAANTFRGVTLVNREGAAVDVEKVGPISDTLDGLKVSIKARLGANAEPVLPPAPINPDNPVSPETPLPAPANPSRPAPSTEGSK